MSDDVRKFRDALGNFATGVTIITTMSDDGEPIGLTANSFSSVSLDPPLVLFCLGRESYSFGHFENSEHFVINILGADQQEQSNHFARPSTDKWNDITYDVCDNGCPAFRNALAIFECAKHDVHDAGDHIIIVGRVESFEHKGEGDPLLYYRGRYAQIAQIAEDG